MQHHYELFITAEFCAAHRLDGYPGNCRNTHGHNWGVEVFVHCASLDELGMGLDFRAIKAAVKDVLAQCDHAFLNDLPPFSSMNPTAENIARHLYGAIGARLNDERVRVSRVRVIETPGAGVTYWAEA